MPPSLAGMEPPAPEARREQRVDASLRASRGAMARLAGMKAQLDQMPEVRPEMVARGKDLLARPDWPPERAFDAVAEIMVDDFLGGTHQPEDHGSRREDPIR